MALTTADVDLAHHNGQAAEAMLDELADAYADAYGVEPGEKSEAFRGRAQSAFKAAGFDLVTARAAGELVGFVFGYRLRPERGWWDGLDPEPPPGFTEETGTRTVVLSEIEVRKAWQRQGLGRLLQAEFLRDRPEERATLATGLEVPSQHVYPRWGWTRVGQVPGKLGAYFSAYHRFVVSLPLPRP